MNRNDEYNSLLEEPENTPVELEYTLVRAEAKIRGKNKYHFFTVPLSSIAAFLIVFTILVNYSTTFVYAVGRIPLIKDLAQLVAFSPSLSAAIENEYVQPLKLEQTKNNVTARVEHVIVDQKQLNIFYSLDSKAYANMGSIPEVKGLTGKDLESYSLHSGSTYEASGKLRHMTADFVEKDMPSGIRLILKVTDDSLLREEAVEVMGGYLIDEEVMGEYLLDEKVDKELDYIAEFIFELKFDPYYTDQGETFVLNQAFEIDKQLLTITTAEIYPTHIRLNFTDDENNTAWLQSFDFYLENEKGNRYKPISNGITATGSQDSPMMASHRLESSFFSESKELTLCIAGVTWLDKDMEKVRLDLKNEKIEALPQDVRLEKIERKDNSWILEFSAKEYKEGASYQLWGWDYYDEENNEYRLDGSSSNTNMDMPGRFEEQFALKNYPYDMVYLSPSYSRIVNLPRPIKIKVK